MNRATCWLDAKLPKYVKGNTHQRHKTVMCIDVHTYRHTHIYIYIYIPIFVIFPTTANFFFTTHIKHVGTTGN